MKYSRYVSNVKHKRSLQRALNNYYERFEYIQVESHKEELKLICVDNPELLTNTIVYEKDDANRVMIDIVAIEEAIDSMFEHGKYRSCLKKIIQDWKVIIKFSNGSVESCLIFLNEISKNQEVHNKVIPTKDFILNSLQTQLEAMTGEILPRRFILKLYTSIKNRTIFKTIYCDENGHYNDYHESKKSQYNIVYIHPQVNIIKKHFEHYKKNKFIFSLWREFDYYLDESKDGIEFPVNDPIVFEWRQKYKLLQGTYTLDTLYASVKFLSHYIEPFSDFTLKPISLVASDGRVFSKTVQRYLDKHHPDEKYDVQTLAKMHRFINQVISVEEQQEILTAYETWPDTTQWDDLSIDIYKPTEFDF